MVPFGLRVSQLYKFDVCICVVFFVLEGCGVGGGSDYVA